MALIEKVCLYYREGTSDKIYEIHLTREDEEGEETTGFRVTGYNGRRGTKLVPQSKTPRPVPYRTARLIFDNLEAMKLNHRRTPYRVGSREQPVDVGSHGVNVAPPPVASLTDSTASSSVVSHLQPAGCYLADFLDALELE